LTVPADGLIGRDFVLAHLDKGRRRVHIHCLVLYYLQFTKFCLGGAAGKSIFPGHFAAIRQSMAMEIPVASKQIAKGKEKGDSSQGPLLHCSLALRS